MVSNEFGDDSFELFEFWLASTGGTHRERDEGVVGTSLLVDLDRTTVCFFFLTSPLLVVDLERERPGLGGRPIFGRSYIRDLVDVVWFISLVPLDSDIGEGVLDRLLDFSPRIVLIRGLLELFKFEFFPPSLSSLHTAAADVAAFNTMGLHGTAALRNELADSSTECDIFLFLASLPSGGNEHGSM